MENIVTAKKKKTLLIIGAAVAVVLIALFFLIIGLTADSTSDKLAEQLELGQKYLDELDYEQAIIAYEAALKIDPKSEEVYLGLSETYMAMGNIAQAAEVLNEGYMQTGAEELVNYLAEVQENKEEGQTDKQESGIGDEPGETGLDEAKSETIIKTLSPGNYHIVSSNDGCPYRIVSTNGCVASYIAYSIKNTFFQVVYKESIDSEFMESFGTSGIDVTIEEGQMEIISLWNETEEEKSELFVSDLGHPAVYGKVLSVGDSLIIENEYFDGHIGSNSVILHGKAVTSVNKVKTTCTDYWWNRYMGWEIEETTFEDSFGLFYTYCKSCSIVEYTVLEGEVKVYVKYDDKDKLKFNPE